MATPSCALARSKLARRVAELREPSKVEKATTAIKAGFVGSVVTPMRALAGNASWGSLRHLVLQPSEAAIDYLLSVGQAARTGFKTQPHEFRQVANALDRDGLAAMWHGFKRGAAVTGDAAHAAGAKGGSITQRVANFVDELSTRLDADNIAKAVDTDRIKYKSPVSQTLVDGAFAVLEAADRPFWKMGFDASLYMQSKLMAIREGLKGDAMRKRAEFYFEIPTDEMNLRAVDDANYVTFKDRNVLSRTATSIKRSLAGEAKKEIDKGVTGYARQKALARKRGAAVGQYVVETTIPFTGVPSSVAAKIGAVSPLGFLSPALLGSQAERARVLAQAGVGSAIMAVGFELAKRGDVTGAAPVQANERAQWDEEGRQPYSIKIGNDWVGLQSLGPVASSLFMGAKLAEIRDEDPDAGVAEQGIRAGFAGAKYLTQQAYIQSIGNLVEAAQDERKATSIIASQIPLPALGGQINRALDSKRRDTKALKDKILARIPGGTFLSPEKVGVQGEPLTKSPEERVAAVASPFPVRRSTETPLLAEMRRLDVQFGVPSRTLTINKKSESISTDDYREFLREAGSTARGALEALTNSSRYAELDDEKKKAALEHVLKNAKDRARLPLKLESRARSVSDPVEAEALRVGIALPDDPAVRAAVARAIESDAYRDSGSVAEQLTRTDLRYKRTTKKALARTLKRQQIESAIAAANR